MKTRGWLLSSVVLAASLTVTGCQTKQQTGAVTGAGLGALAGGAIGDTTGSVVGGLLGAFVGSEIGRRMDREDELMLARTFEYAPTNQPSQWVNPDTGASYSVTPLRTYTEASGNACREFRMFADVGTDQEEIVGTACRQQDGSWRIVNTQSAEGVAEY